VWDVFAFWIWGGLQVCTPTAAPGHKWDFHTHSFALKVFRWRIVVHILKISPAKRSNSQHFWLVSRVESTLLEDRVVN